MAKYISPGVYIEEVPKIPPLITSVETAIPVFVGYTEKASFNNPGDLHLIPYRITSVLEYEQFYGVAFAETGLSVSIDFSTGFPSVEATINNRSNYLFYYAIQLYFENGGGPCHIVSVGEYELDGIIEKTTLSQGLVAAAKVDEITLILFPDSMNLASVTDYYELHNEAITQAKDLKDRFVVMDVYHDENISEHEKISTARDLITGSTHDLSYAAIYYPRIFSGLDYYFGDTANPGGNDELVNVTGTGGFEFEGTLATLKEHNNALYFQAKASITQLEMHLPASFVVAGKYAEVDRTRGVWKAPANVGLNNVTRPEILITDQEQQDLNVDPDSGKSINVIRSFTGRGVTIWGARTIAGNDNEWRYISVRRFANMIEESITKGIAPFVFEPNDANTWTKIRAMIENYLILQWRAGALAGSRPEESFYVKIGLNETMSVIDILEGRMIVELGFAPIRPAEFIILKFVQKMIQE